jgi:hypothetical protein
MSNKRSSSSSTTTPPPASSTRYAARDFNFRTCRNDELECLCTHRIPIRSKYPKLVIDLFFHPRLREWRSSSSSSSSSSRLLTDTDLVGSLIGCVGAHCDRSGVSACLDISPAAMLQMHEECFRNATPELVRENLETPVTESVQKELQNTIYGNYTDSHLHIQQSRRTRKRGVGGIVPADKKRPGRFVCIQ